MIPTIIQNPRHLFGPGALLYRDDPKAKLNFHYDLTRRFTYFGHNHEFMDLVRLVNAGKFQWVGLATNGDFPDYAVMYTIRSRAEHHGPSFEYVNPYVKIAGHEPHVADMIVATPTIKDLVDQATGVHYVLFRGNSLFNILLKQSDPGHYDVLLYGTKP